MRLIPFVERNYNLVELGPKGTGKSHIFSEFSPHGMLISGGEVTVPKLFVNNSNGRIGLVGYWDVVAFDEFAGKKKRTDKALVDIMKNYMANKSFSRGVETLGAEASMVFVGNTSHNVPYMLKHSDLFDELPESYHDSAYLDRLHHYIPGWEVDTIRGEMFSEGYGFVVDYIAEVLKSMRDADYSDRYQEHFTLGSDISTRDRDGIHKTFSGLMKILYPHGEATQEEIEEILRFAIEGRKRVKDQILRIDSTMADVKFGYLDKAGEWHAVTTLEEDEYPAYYHQRPATMTATSRSCGRRRQPTVRGRRRGDSRVAEAGAALRGSPRVPGEPARCLLRDPAAPVPAWRHRDHDRRPIHPSVPPGPQPHGTDRGAGASPRTPPTRSRSCSSPARTPKVPRSSRSRWSSCSGSSRRAAVAGITLDVKFDATIHDRSIVADSGWRINLGRGLDIFQFVTNDAFDLAVKLQQYRQVKAFGVTYIREG